MSAAAPHWSSNARWSERICIRNGVGTQDLSHTRRSLDRPTELSGHFTNQIIRVKDVLNYFRHQPLSIKMSVAVPHWSQNVIWSENICSETGARTQDLSHTRRSLYWLSYLAPHILSISVLDKHRDTHPLWEEFLIENQIIRVKEVLNYFIHQPLSI